MLVMIENRVVSCPPCWLALAVKAAPTLPLSTPEAHRPPAPSRKLAICEDMRPKRVPVPIMMAS